MSKSDMGVAKRGALPDTTAQRPSASSGDVPRLDYYDGTAALCATDGETPGRVLAFAADNVTDAEMFEIVRRCNAHYELVGALRLLFDHAIAVGSIGASVKYGNGPKAYEVARAILAEVEGK